jgi:signal recognition particle subunit SRP19
MRKRNKIVLWSVYFDASKSRAEGRRVPKKLAIQSPKLTELQQVAGRMGLQPELKYDAAHPSNPWQKTGMLIFPKTDSKNVILQLMAKELTNLRK